MELAGNLSVSISLPVSGQLGCQLECRVIYVKRSGRNYGIVLAKINEIYCALLRHDHVFSSSPLSRHFQVTFE